MVLHGNSPEQENPEPARVGKVVVSGRQVPPYVLLDAADAEVAPVTEYLTDLALSDMSALTCRSYAFDLLRWFRLLWAEGTDWERVTGTQVGSLVAWMKRSENPQRNHIATAKGTQAVNIRTFKPSLGPGYAPRTINHVLSVVKGFYDFHAQHSAGPVANPVPSNDNLRRSRWTGSGSFALPRRGRFRQRVPHQQPRAIPDHLWDELFASMGCPRDRALLCIYVSSGTRANELLSVTVGDVDWASQLIHVVSKGTRARDVVPVSAEGLRYLGDYLQQSPAPATSPLWRTRRGPERALTYNAARRVIQRANDKLGTNWTLHDLRHTAATRMANDPNLTLSEVRTVLRHAHISTTGLYTGAKVEHLVERLQEHYSRPAQTRQYAATYDPDDIATVFGG
ncbi:tyrosine-type recombinase/integrase [Arthrobacter sp. ISL-95]|nr:tyrosine-type recombinase/integrase [Arthrobacter sp. ISL-95]